MGNLQMSLLLCPFIFQLILFVSCSQDSFPQPQQTEQQPNGSRLNLRLRGRNSDESKWLRRNPNQEYRIETNHMPIPIQDTQLKPNQNDLEAAAGEEGREWDFVDPEKENEFQQLQKVGNQTAIKEYLENQFPNKGSRNLQFDPNYPKKISYGVVTGIVAGVIALLLGAIKLCVYCVKNDSREWE